MNLNFNILVLKFSTNLYSMIFFQGLSLGGRLQRLTSNLLNLHIVLSRPMSKQVVLLICKLISLIKSVQDCFYRHTKHVAFNSQHVVQRIQFNILNSMLAVKVLVGCIGVSKTILYLSYFRCCNLKKTG